MSVAAPPPSRHRTGRRGAPARQMFVKAARSPAHRADLIREASVYGLVRERCPAMHPLLPEGVRWDPDADELQMEDIDAGDLADLVTTSGSLDPTVAAEVGRAVGVLHAEAGPPGDDAPRSPWLRGGIGVHRPGPDHLRAFSAGGLKLLEALQRSDALRSRLADLAEPSGDEFVHGDLRWENILVADSAAPRVWLVDWEMGGAGEHAWDVGCVLAAGVSAWLSSIPVAPGVPPDRLASEAAVPIESLEAGVNAFWSAYRETSPPRADGWAERCVQLAAVRLVHLGFESTELDVGLRPSAVAHLQVASNILRDPWRAGRDLRGLP